MNEVGSKDFLPALAESVTWGYGSAGTYGFRVPRVRDRWHNNCHHSTFLTSEFCKKYWVPFFRDGQIIDADIESKQPPILVRLMSRVRIKYLLVFLLTFLGFHGLSSTAMYRTLVDWASSVSDADVDLDSVAPPQPKVLYSQKPGCDVAFQRVPPPLDADPDQIRILNNWVERNIVDVEVPQLEQVPYGSSSGKVRFNVLAAEALKEAWAEVEKRGLLSRVTSFDGAFVSRTVRGRDEISPHACGLAFDINYSANPIGTVAPIAQHGSVFELVPIFKQHGFTWGGEMKGVPEAGSGGHFEFIVKKN